MAASQALLKSSLSFSVGTFIDRIGFLFRLGNGHFTNSVFGGVEAALLLGLLLPVLYEFGDVFNA